MSILVVGAGIMGRGIAFIAATKGQRNVVLVDASPEALSDSHAYFTTLAEKSGLDPQAIAMKITTRPSVEEAFQRSDFDFAIEAVTENVKVKTAVFQALAQHAGPRTILATNTSSIPVTRIADTIVPRERVIGMHFFNPVTLMQGLEVIRTQYTDTDVIERTIQLGKSMGKQVVLCEKDIAGFIVNRILTAQLLEATKLFERGVAPPAEIDRVMKSAAGVPMGPFRLCDLVGLDTILALTRVIYEDSGNDPRYKPSPTIEQLVSEGKLGSKSGQGFYSYAKDKNGGQKRKQSKL